MDNIRLAAHRDSGKAFCYAVFGEGKILMARLTTSDEGNNTGLCFMDLPDAEAVNKSIALTDEERKTMLQRSQIVFEFSSVGSIDAVMNMLLECRNALTGEKSKKQPVPIQLEMFNMYLNSHYQPVDGMWQSKLTADNPISLIDVWKEFTRLS